jgi:phenylpropionate dioxygenase-like ring-hydroxylating dioxygenase large terminal subunit
MDSGKTLPASWFTSPNLYSLELRAVFQKSWYFLGTVKKFKAGEDIDFEFAGINITVHCDNDEAHQESYKVANTDTLSPLPQHLTPTGLLFCALSPSAPPFTQWFPTSLHTLLSKHDFRRLPYRKTIKYPGRFNWKTMVDGYQECLHCQYTHRSFSVKYPPTFYEVHSHDTYSRHIADPKKPDDGLFLFFFPICTLNLYGGGMSSFRVCPVSETETRMEFDYYFDDGNGGTEGFDEYYKFVRRVATEDFELCEVAQKNLERGVYSQVSWPRCKDWEG